MLLDIDKTFRNQQTKNLSLTMQMYPINDKKAGCHRPTVTTLLHPKVKKDQLTKEQQNLLNYYMEDVKGIIEDYEDKTKIARRLKVNKCKGMGLLTIDVPYSVPVVIPRAFVALMDRMSVPVYSSGIQDRASKYVAGADNSIPTLKVVGRTPRLIFRAI